MTTTATTKKLTMCALFAALTGVCSQIAIPLPMIPLNLALMAVHLSGALLGANLGAASQIVFALLGAVGIPVFTGFTGGLGILAGPTGGYILGYVAAAWLGGFLIRKWDAGFWKSAAAMALGVAACYTFGTIWFIVLTGKGLVAALGLCVLPFIPGDVVKIAAAAYLASRLRRPLAIIGCGND